MESRILQVFYGNDCLPFKDKERSVHFPIVGNAFLGTNNIQKIRFYVDRIGGALNVTWVATTKLPNGKVIYELLNETQYDDEIGEYYVELTLTQPYSALKGDLFIGLSGYQGGVQVEEDSDTGIYSITGTPTIQATGVIKFSINYAPSTLPKETLGFTDLQQVLGYLADFLQQGDSIVVIANTSVDLTGFEEGQIFFCKADQLIYKLVIGSLVVQKSGYVPYTGATANVHLGPYSLSANTLISQDTEFADNEVIITKEYANVYKFRVKSDTTEDFIATEDYVDNNIYEMASASVVLSDNDYAYLLKNNVRIHYGNFFYEKAKETASQVIFYSVDYQRTTTGGSTGYTTRTTKKITLTKSSQQLDAADINDLSYNKEQTDKNFAHSLSLQLNTTNYKLSVYLYDKDGNALSTQTIDLPLESIVVSATYYDSYTYGGTTYQKVIVIVLATTDVPTIIPVGDLVDGLATTTQLTNGLALKVNKSDIADNLTTNDATKVLSAKQGYELNNAVVHNTGNETIAGNKTFTGSTSFKYDINFTSPDGTKSGAFRLVDNGNFIWRVANASKFMYDYANGNFSSWVDIVGNGDNAQSLGNASHYWKDLYLKGKWKDGTNEKSLQDLLDENSSLQYQLNQLKEEFYETTIDIQSYEYQYLLTDTIPLLINSKNVVESIGMDCVNVKGNSYVYNQWAKELNSTYWQLAGSTGSITNEVATFTATSRFGGVRFKNDYRDIKLIANHNLLFACQIKLTTATSNVKLALNWDNGFGESSVPTQETTNWQLVIKLITFGNITYNDGYMQVFDNRSSDFDEIQVSNLQIFDLTQLGIDSVSTTDQALAELMKLGINPYEYNPYNDGKIVNSKPTKLVSGGFNVLDEQLEQGGLSTTTGETTANTNQIRSKNFIKVRPNQTLYGYVKSLVGTTVGNLVANGYDKNQNFVGYLGGLNGTTLTIPGNVYYIKVWTGTAYGGTYKNDICINISNATLNGTYCPYIAPTEYALDLPILRGVGTAQDDKEKVRIGVVDLGSLSWTYSSSNEIMYSSGISTLVFKVGANAHSNIMCVEYQETTSNNLFSSTDVDKSISIGTDGYIYLRDKRYTDAAAFKTAMDGIYLYYELATPTDQPTITLPENIAIQKGGTITAEYDSTDNAPSDFDFEFGTSNIQ